MKPFRLLLLLLIAAALSVDALCASLLGKIGGGIPSLLLELATLVMLFSQLALAAIWVALGTGAWPLRLLVVSALTFLFTRPTAEIIRGGESWAFAALHLVLLAACVVIAATPLRQAGYRFASDFDPLPRERRSTPQFALAHLLVWTAVVAVIASMVRRLQAEAGDWLGLDEWFDMVAIVGGLVACAITCVVVQYRTEDFLMRFLGVLGVSAATGIAIAMLTLEGPILLSFYVFQSLLLLAWLEICAMDGVRIVRIVFDRRDSESGDPERDSVVAEV